MLGRWSGWGAIAQQAFHPSYADDFGPEQAELRTLLNKREYAAAKRSTLNAHYTDASLVQTLWQGLEDLGVRGGNVLEPGCGSGAFVGLAPAGTHMTGVELDSTTAAIASLLYPRAQIRAESFVDTRAPSGAFDAAVGNVPFGDHKLYDPEHNPGQALSIHNHFILKSLDLTKPGGVVALITSHHTMDNQDGSARSRIAQHADVLGVVRLPSSAHREAAGTQVVTDILLLRKRSRGEEEAHLGSITDGVRDLAAEDESVELPVNVNTYFDAHPDHVLGTPSWRSGQFGPQLHVSAQGPDLATQLRQALSGIVDRAHQAGLGAVPAAPGTEHLQLADASKSRYEGLIQVDEQGRLTRLHRGRAEPYTPSQGREELTQLVGLRDTVVELMDTEQVTAVETPHLATLRRRLNTQYEAYVARYGYINRRNIDKNGQASRPIQGKFRLDPLSAYVYGLEEYDSTTHTATKRGVFTSRALKAPARVDSADSPRDALYVALRESATVDLERIAELLGADSPAEARTALGELVYHDPEAEELVSAPAYLSGDVRRKLRQARRAAENDPQLRANVRALEQVQPTELTAAEILPQLGAAWIPPEVVEEFARQVLQNEEIQVRYTGQGRWWVSDHGQDSHQADTVLGTKAYPANALLQSALDMKTVEVRRIDPETRSSVVDTQASAAAEAKMQALRERFNTWLWQDPERTETLVEVYNDTYNALRLRDYDAEVRTDRVFPGLVEGFLPRPHQTAAVERVLAQDAVLLAHPTGAGKTSELIMNAMEARRLGQVNKPAIVVPNNVIEQFAAEFRQRYPNARVLVADTQRMERKYRQEFLSQVALGDWDAVIFTHEQFEKIPMDFETVKRRLEEEYEHHRGRFERLSEEGEVDRATIKQAERAFITAEERLRKHTEGTKDQGWTFEHTGIDMIQVDEAHKYKNLSVVSNIVDAAKVASNRANDMLMKFDHVREMGGKLVMATATPLANSISELWAFTRFLNPQWLVERDLMDFDRWAATFAVQQSVPEVDEANKLRMRTRLAKFRNVPELQVAWSYFCDARTKQQLGLPEPEITWYDEHGKRQEGARSLLLPPTPEQLEYQTTEIEDRMRAFRSGQPWVMGHKHDEATGETYEVKDHTLWIGNHAQANALDRRLAPGSPKISPLAQQELKRSLQELERFNALAPEAREQRMVQYQELLTARSQGRIADEEVPEWFNAMALGLTKTDTAADLLYRTWHVNKDRVFLDRHTGQPHPRTGALQLVFCDSGVWTKSKGTDQYTVYEDLRERLVSMGMEREQIRFIQEAGGDDRKKAELFEACRNGRVSVLIGSTEGMGVGTNVQDRAVHLLHMDCPWRPCDIEQREGRIERQGNQSDEITITRLTTANSYDAKKWSTNARKAGFIGQIMRGEITAREIEDIDPQEADFFATASLAANSPRQQAYAETRQKLSVLEMEFQNWQSAQATSRQVLQWIPHRIDEADTFISELDAVLGRRVSTRGDRFGMQVGQRQFDTRKKAGQALKDTVSSLAQAHPGRGSEPSAAPVGVVGALSVTATVGFDPKDQQKWVRLSFEDLPSLYPTGRLAANAVAVGSQQDLEGANPVSLCRSLERVLDKVEDVRAAYVDYRQRQQDNLRQAQEHLKSSFPHTERLQELRAQSSELEQELGISVEQRHSSQAEAEASDAEPEPTAAGGGAPDLQTPGNSPAPTTSTAPQPSAHAGGGSSGTGSAAPDRPSKPRPGAAAESSPGHAAQSADEGAEQVASPLERAWDKLAELKDPRTFGASKNAMTSMRVRLYLLVEAVERGEHSRESALEVFTELNTIRPKKAYAREELRQRVAVPSAHSPHFAAALTVLHDREQTVVRVPAPMADDLAGLLTSHGFEPTATQTLWQVSDPSQSERERSLSRLLVALDTREGVERMRSDYAQHLQEQPQAEGEREEVELRSRVEALIAEADLRAAWELVSERLQELRADNAVSEAELAQSPVGRLRSEILIQARRYERELDAERAQTGQLSHDQNEDFTHRYRRTCPHLDAEQIRQRLDTAPEQTRSAREAYALVQTLASAPETDRQGHRLQLESALEELAQSGAPDLALGVVTAANAADPAGAWMREAVRTRLVLEAAPHRQPLLAFSDKGEHPQVYASVHTPASTRRLLAEHGWAGLDGPLDPVLSLRPDTTVDPQQQLEEKLVTTLLALDTHDEPVSRVKTPSWATMRQDQSARQALVEQEPQVLEEVAALVENGQLRQGVHRLLHALEERRSTALVERIYNESLLVQYVDLMVVSYDHEQALDGRREHLNLQDEDQALGLASDYWQQCPHLSLEQIAQRIGRTSADLLPAEGEQRRMYALEQGSTPAEPVERDAFAPVLKVIEHLNPPSGLQDRVGLQNARKAFTATLAEVHAQPGIDQDRLGQMFVLANQADPDGAWGREDLRSKLFYPADRYHEGTPLLVVDPAGNPPTVRVLDQRDQVPEGLWEQFQELGLVNRKSDPPDLYSLPHNLRADTRTGRLNTLVAYCDSVGAQVITHAQHDERQQARQIAELKERDRRLTAVAERTPQVRAAAQDLHTQGRLREAVETIREHWIDLELLGQEAFQGYSDARKHELWPLHEQLHEAGRERHSQIKAETDRSDRQSFVAGLRRSLVECPHLSRSKVEEAIRLNEEALARELNPSPEETEPPVQDDPAVEEENPVDPTSTPEPDSATQRADQALTRIEGRPFSPQEHAAWNDLDQALSELHEQGRYQEVLDTVSKARGRSDYNWWRWEHHRSRAVAAQDPSVLERALVLHHEVAENRKGRTHLYGVRDEELKKFLKKELKFNNKVSEQRWQINPRWGINAHTDRLRQLITHLDSQGVSYLSHQVYEEVRQAPTTAGTPEPAPTQEQSLPAEDEPAPTPSEPEAIPVTPDGHLSQINEVLRTPATVTRINEFTLKYGPRAGQPSWLAIYDLGQGREVVSFYDEDPHLRQGQALSDFTAKVKRHTWYKPKNGPSRPRTEVLVAPPRPEKAFALTHEQEQIRDHALAQEDLVVQAGAGTGKTATVTQVAEGLTQQGRRGAYVVFGRANAREADLKLAHVPGAVDTLHAFARAAVGAPYNDRINTKIRPDAQKSMQELGLGALTLPNAPWMDRTDLYKVLEQAVRTFEKSADLALDASHIPPVPGHSSQDTAAVRRHLAPALDRVWQDMLDPQGSLFRFVHESYVKIWHLSGAQMDFGGRGTCFLLVDEAQDINPVAEAILRAQTHMQIIWVGDSSQAIHAWRGAKDALEHQNVDTELTLSRSFRFGEQVAQQANKVLDQLEAPLRLSGNPELDTRVHDESVHNPDALLSRTNAGAFTAAVDQIAQGRTVAIMGGTRDLEDLATAAEELIEYGSTRNPELAHLESWKKATELAREQPEELDGLAPFINVLATRGIDQVRDTLRQVVDEDPDVWVSTAHRSKGLEWDRVQIGDDFRPKDETEYSRAEVEAELRLVYVALTRGKVEIGRGPLAYIDSLGSDRTEESTTQEAETAGPRQMPQSDPTPSLPEANNEEQQTLLQAAQEQGLLMSDTITGEAEESATADSGHADQPHDLDPGPQQSPEPDPAQADTGTDQATNEPAPSTAEQPPDREHAPAGEPSAEPSQNPDQEPTTPSPLEPSASETADEMQAEEPPAEPPAPAPEPGQLSKRPELRTPEFHGANQAIKEALKSGDLATAQRIHEFRTDPREGGVLNAAQQPGHELFTELANAVRNAPSVDEAVLRVIHRARDTDRKRGGRAESLRLLALAEEISPENGRHMAQLRQVRSNLEASESAEASEPQRPAEQDERGPAADTTAETTNGAPSQEEVRPREKTQTTNEPAPTTAEQPPDREHAPAGEPQADTAVRAQNQQPSEQEHTQNPEAAPQQEPTMAEPDEPAIGSEPGPDPANADVEPDPGRDYYDDLADEAALSEPESETPAGDSTQQAPPEPDNAAPREAAEPAGQTPHPSVAPQRTADEDEGLRAEISADRDPRQNRPRLNIDLPGTQDDDQEQESGQQQGQRRLHIDLPGQEADEPITGEAARDDGDERVNAGRPQLTGPEPETIDGRDIRSKMGSWRRTLHGQGRTAALEKTNPGVYRTMRQRMEKVMDTGQDVHLVMPSNDMTEVRRFIELAKARGYEVTVSARIPPATQRIADVVSSLNEHLNNNTVHQAVLAKQHTHEYGQLKDIMTNLYEERLADRLELYPRTGAVPSSTYQLTGDVGPDGTLSDPYWNSNTHIRDVIHDRLETVKLSPEELGGLRSQMQEISQQLPQEQELRGQRPDVRQAHADIVEGINWLSQKVGFEPADKDTAARTTVEMPETGEQVPQPRQANQTSQDQSEQDAHNPPAPHQQAPTPEPAPQVPEEPPEPYEQPTPETAPAARTEREAALAGAAPKGPLPKSGPAPAPTPPPGHGRAPGQQQRTGPRM